MLEVSELPLLAPPLLLYPLCVVAGLLVADDGGHDGVRHVPDLQQHPDHGNIDDDNITAGALLLQASLTDSLLKVTEIQV